MSEVTKPPPRIPTVPGLPTARSRRMRPSGKVEGAAPIEDTKIKVTLHVVTPILGGAPRPRTIDEVDIIRPGTVRGHLRFWWRALHVQNYESPKDLYKAESELWGKAAEKEGGGRSGVEIRVQVDARGELDDSQIQLQDKGGTKKTPGSYALFVARGPQNGDKPAPRRKPGTKFTLTLTCLPAHKREVEDSLRAWILFGGYGGRTRRGLGSLTVVVDLNHPSSTTEWLPKAATKGELSRLFGERDIFADATNLPRETPSLAGASLRVLTPQTPSAVVSQVPAEQAWTTALGWLSAFRQGIEGGPGARAREPGPPDGNRPSISNWPEADKIRHLSKVTPGLPWAHRPRTGHMGSAAWPRAGFGLPISIRFQEFSRVEILPRPKKGPKLFKWRELSPPSCEPQPVEIRWRSPGKGEGEWVEHDRLASPLIVKALPLADGTFVPCALWLNRCLPPGAQMGLAAVETRPGGKKQVNKDTVATFDVLVAPGDTPQFSALKDKRSLKEAFLDWLKTRHGVKEVAP